MKQQSHLAVYLYLIVAGTGIGTGADLDLQAEGDLQWYRGNMHTHSLWSDGDDYPEMIASWYRENGYQFLVHTDHNVMMRGERWIDVEKNKGGQKAFDKLIAKFPEDWVDTRTKDERLQVRLKSFDEVFDRLASPQDFLLVQGEEITDRYRNMPVHMCATNLSELLPPLNGDSVLEVMQNNVNAAISHRERTGEKTLIHLNHPNFHYGVTAEQLMRVVGENFFEVYNGHPSVNDSGDATHASTERMWDIINSWRLSQLDLPVMYGLATDDSHAYHEKTPGKASQPGRGWVMVLAETLTPEALVTALEAGQFYASTGVTLERVRVSNDVLSVHVRPDDGLTYSIDFIGTMKGFDSSSEPAMEAPDKVDSVTRTYSDEVGAVLKSASRTTATYQLTGDELYVRAVVTSSKRHANPSEEGDFEKAWTQPVVLKR